MTSANEVFVKNLEISPRAKEAIAASMPDVRNPTVRQVIENTTAAHLRALPGVGDGTVDEIQAAFRSACDVSLRDRWHGAPAPAPVAEVEAPKKASRPRKKAR